MIVSGKISVKAILENRKRDIVRVIMLETHKDREARYVQRISEGLPIEYLSREEMDALAENTSHGGYLVECGKRISDTVDNDMTSVLCIEGLSDPYNLGEILRTAMTFGFDTVITNAYDFYDHEAKLIRASAGASEHVSWILSEDIVSTLKQIKKKGIHVLSTHRGDDSTSLTQTQFPEKVCICLGGAYRGLSRSVLDASDGFVRLDYDARVSLSTLGATTVFAYERFRQLEGKE